MQPCKRIDNSKVYWRLIMLRAANCSSSGAPNCICSLWFIYPCGDRPLPRQRPVTTWVYKPEAANTVWSSWWWAVCRSKHVEPSINFGIINYITKLHIVGISAVFLTWVSQNTSKQLTAMKNFEWSYCHNAFSSWLTVTKAFQYDLLSRNVSMLLTVTIHFWFLIIFGSNPQRTEWCNDMTCQAQQRQSGLK
jgi:hypothetical protein